MKQEVLQLEPLLGSYGACKFSHTFPMEKSFNYSPLKLHVCYVFVVKSHSMSSVILYIFVANGELFAQRYL